MNSEIFTNFPEYKTSRLILRKLSLEDTQLMYQFNSDPDCLRFIARSPYTHISQAEGRVIEFTDAFEQHKALWWTVILKETLIPIGYCGLFEIDKSVPKAEVGYGFLKKYWGCAIRASYASIPYPDQMYQTVPWVRDFVKHRIFCDVFPPP